MLTYEDKQTILNEFPNIKLSYEAMIHKKVYNCDFMMAIPIGIKCFAWFTTFHNKYVCILFELENNRNKEIKNIRIINTCFSRSLCYGTIIYGTLFNHMNQSFFSIEDVFCYKGKDMSRENWITKINTIIEMLKHNIKQISYNKYFVVFGLPLIAKTDNQMSSLISSVNYKLDTIKYYTANSNSCFVLSFEKYTNPSIQTSLEREKTIEKTIEKKPFEKQVRGKIFICKPDIQNDIYHLYTMENEYAGLASIPDYKTSVMMNTLFRNIKENVDLDALEESDDEDEFENANVDKFVHLDKTYKMVCNFNYKFKKWVPVSVSN